jgi:hypothetical protein
MEPMSGCAMEQERRTNPENFTQSFYLKPSSVFFPPFFRGTSKYASWRFLFQGNAVY